jgi:polysaccharide chain length determinant protein (PEP-CTERM system associated)
MAEVFDEEKTEQLDIHRYLDVARRRHLHFLLPFFFGWLIVWGVSWILPARYKSGTLILVEQPTMPKNYVMPNVSDDLQGRLQSITQQILSRTRLLLIIDKLHLYAEKRHPITPDKKVDLMRKDIDIELVHDSQKDEITAFRIYYSAHDPRVAQQVTTELTDLFITDNLKVRQRESEDTTKFIENQLENARASLTEQEEQVREFEGKHEGELPSQQASNLQILSGLQSQLQNEQDALNTAKQQRVYTQTLIEQSRALRASPRTDDGTLTGTSSINQEIDQLKAKLADLRSRYTDRHPDVQNLKDEIAATEKKRDEHIAESKLQGNSGRLYDSPSDPSASNLSQSSPMLQLQGQLQGAQAEIANREESLAALKAKVNSYQARLNAEPVIEQQLADLTRGYDQSKANYDDLLKKKNGSEMATSMEQMQQGERFSILDPPSLPLKPDSPNRLKLCALGLGLGLVLGLIVAGGVEFTDDRLHSEKEIRSLLPIEIISEIPAILSASQERSNKTRAVLGWSMAALVGGAILVGSAFSYLHS